MPLTLILGPMKSGKSSELIARVAPLEYAGKKVLYVRTNRNTRDKNINSRLGINTRAISVDCLSDVTQRFDVIGIDEINMFDPVDVIQIEHWVKKDKHVFISGLNLDYRGFMPPIVRLLYEAGPDEVINKIAVCEVCRSYEARFTQVLDTSGPVLEGLPLVIPEDGTFDYQPRCRNCFKRLAFKTAD